MKKDLLRTYIDKINKEDIVNYLSKECIEASEEEINFIYKAIKEDHDEILDTNLLEYLSKQEITLNRELYKKIIEKYNEYRRFIE